ncbi:MAG: hypothetical protein QOH93_2265 [Chloroflexia bacterium]|jgi:hypothetical protein|nr:hypothetical protein [Chloroflexia bacterium]
MVKQFVGTGHKEPISYDVHVEQDSKRYSLMHRVQGSYVDFQWDGGGPETTDLARALLWEATGIEPEWRIYRHFKNEVVMAWPRHEGECWRISEMEILLWLEGVEQDLARTEDPGQTVSRREQTRQRESRLKSFAQIFRRRL